MNRLFVVLGLVAAVVFSAVLTLWPTDDPTSVSNKFAQRVATEVPGVQVAQAGEFMLYLGRDERVWGVNLDQLQNRCHDGAGVCQTAGSELIAELVRLVEAPARPDMPLLRPTLTRPPAAAPFAKNVITQPWVGDLAVSYQFIGKPVAEFVTSGLVQSLKLDPKVLQARAIAEMDSSHEAPVLRPLLGKRGVSYLEAQGDPAGEVLSRARMQVLSERTGVKKFYIGFPVRNMVLFANANTPDGLADLRFAVADMRAAFGAQPVSDRIYVLEHGELSVLP